MMTTLPFGWAHKLISRKRDEQRLFEAFTTGYVRGYQDYEAGFRIESDDELKDHLMDQFDAFLEDHDG